MLEWIISHIDTIIIFLLFTIVFIASLCSKKVNKNILIYRLLMVLPMYINEAENTGLSGSEKFAHVFQRSLAYLVAITGLSQEEVITKFTGFINSSIESILNTPQKKEVTYGESKKNV